MFVFIAHLCTASSAFEAEERCKSSEHLFVICGSNKTYSSDNSCNMGCGYQSNTDIHSCICDTYFTCSSSERVSKEHHQVTDQSPVSQVNWVSSQQQTFSVGSLLKYGLCCGHVSLTILHGAGDLDNCIAALSITSVIIPVTLSVMVIRKLM